MSAISASQAKGPRVLSRQPKSRQAMPHQGMPHQPMSRQALSQPAPGRAEGPAPLRLTRRGKIVLIWIPLMLLTALLLSLAGFFNSPAKASDAAGDLAVTPTITVTVQPGESLWAIAGAVAPERDARDVVADIVQLNNLPAGAVLPGQQLYVPTR